MEPPIDADVRRSEQERSVNLIEMHLVIKLWIASNSASAFIGVHRRLPLLFLD
jgi:hypothetical protein